MVTRVNGYNVSEVVGGVFFKIRDPDGYYYDIQEGWVKNFYDSTSWKNKEYAQKKLLNLSNPDYEVYDLELVEYKVATTEVSVSSPTTYFPTQPHFGWPKDDDVVLNEDADIEETRLAIKRLVETKNGQRAFQELIQQQAQDSLQEAA